MPTVKQDCSFVHFIDHFPFCFCFCCCCIHIFEEFVSTYSCVFFVDESPQPTTTASYVVWYSVSFRFLLCAYYVLPSIGTLSSIIKSFFGSSQKKNHKIWALISDQNMRGNRTPAIVCPLSPYRNNYA